MARSLKVVRQPNATLAMVLDEVRALRADIHNGRHSNHYAGNVGHVNYPGTSPSYPLRDPRIHDTSAAVAASSHIAAHGQPAFTGPGPTNQFTGPVNQFPGQPAGQFDSRDPRFVDTPPGPRARRKIGRSKK